MFSHPESTSSNISAASRKLYESLPVKNQRAIFNKVVNIVKANSDPTFAGQSGEAGKGKKAIIFKFVTPRQFDDMR